ncbi:MAG: hypothetical protein NDJ90_00565 [Oligoflexia bacterium]|nr:hypothetical protein [Oligoflexia bacterium]
MKNLQALILMSAVLAGSAFAETTPTNSTTTATAKAVAPSLRERISASYLGILAGPSLAHPTSSLQPTADGAPDPTSPLTLINQVGLNYKATGTTSVGVQLNFDYSPVRGQDYTINDPALRVSHNSLFKTENASLVGDLRAYVPVSNGSSKAHILTALRSTQSLDYKIPESRFTLTATTFETFYMYANGAKADRSKLRLYFSPSVSYQLNPTTSATLLYELDGRYALTKGWGYRNPMDVNFSMGFDVTPTVNVAPGITIYPNNTVNADAAQLSVVVGAKLL